VDVEMIVTNVTAPLSSVDDVSSVSTVGEGVLVTMKVVGVKDVTINGLCVVVSGTGEGDLGVLSGEDGEQLPKSVEMGLASVMMLVMTSGTDIVETPPMRPLI
jgi:hypothetical protein